MKYRSRLHSVLAVAGFVTALLPATGSAFMGSALAIVMLPSIISSLLLPMAIVINLWALVSGWRLFLFFVSGKNEPGPGCWIGLVIFCVSVTSFSIYTKWPKFELPWLTLAVVLHWLWLYWKDFRLDWRRAVTH
ncbi:hypothetical protein NRB16_19645 [Pseudomonas sp. LJDD11]|uniref:hypothetical protein n=1 Tax=unclassified Pseudomonas TaxID=196821 RepID=UPI0004F90C57|nr:MULTISPECIES: hypothetical protein [unclassified Pseudomonas]MCQ9425731.1 hypothetical protein [Pseudomonas sp. LJDD11]BAP45449.1 Na(+) H(+) antiporter subunit A/B [Pseudomonas sp. StFLB209]